MARLEDLTRGATVRGVLSSGPVTVVDVKWHGSTVVELTYRDATGRLGSELLYRDREPTLEVAAAGTPWTFDADGGLFRLTSEAHRIRLAYLFDPLLAVHTSVVEPLPHQITAVYEEMLKRQPLRFLLADDPGAGKTIMAGLLIKELLARGDLHRCMIVCPGSLAEQWAEEMDEKFHLSFNVMTTEKLEAARGGNWFQETPLAICRLDKLARSEEVQAKLERSDWDLIVVDEAHKMSASFFSGEIKETKRYRLGKLLSGLTRHFLLMTATPHNGKEEDFQLFMALLDGDRFEGRFRDGVHVAQASDLMRRLVKEQLLRFDGRPLFPERRAETVGYSLSPLEADLYRQVTDYVRQEFNKADQGDNRVTVGFALMILQRRLASSPEAIYQSIRRRRERLETRLREEKLLKRGADVRVSVPKALPTLTEDQIDDLEDAPDSELEETEDLVIDSATAAKTIADLESEIGTLMVLEDTAQRVRRSGKDKKWEELSNILQNNPEMFDSHGHRRKLVIFTEHRDTLNYLADKIRTILGRQEAVVVIHGAMGREERKKAQGAFTQDKDVQVLIATDAAGEGINLQRAHLMVNYDLPWNPNRLEQRFGRIHRIGQTEVCHLWNIVASETREGEVYQLLLHKIEEEKKALGGQVFDILGKLTFDGRPLRDLLLEAVRYGDRPETKARLFQVVGTATDREKVRELLEERALARDTMDASRVQAIREEMERAEARRLQPHFIASFFQEAFKLLGGTIRERESKRYEISHVPVTIRDRDRMIGVGAPVLTKYERATFEKNLISIQGKPLAAFVCPGHPLLDSTIDLVLERYRELLKRGTILVDMNDPGDAPRVLLYLEHAVQDGRQDRSGNRRVISRQLQFVELDATGKPRMAGFAPYLDYEPLPEADREAVKAHLARENWLKDDLEGKASAFAIENLVPRHFDEVKKRREQGVARAEAAVKDRLTKEINYWDHRAEELKDQEASGRQPRMNWQKARQRADQLAERLQKRLAELAQERQVSPVPPVVVGGAVIIPRTLAARITGKPLPDMPPDAEAKETERVEMAAMAAVMEAELNLGFVPRDVSADRCGYDVESKAGQGKLRFIEVKGRIPGARTVTITKNEILTALNKPEDFILAIVEVGQQGPTNTEAGQLQASDQSGRRCPRCGAEDVAIIEIKLAGGRREFFCAGCRPSVRYVRRPFSREPDFGVTSVNYDIRELLDRAEDPS